MSGTLRILDTLLAFDCYETSFKAFSVLTELEEIIFDLAGNLQIGVGFSNMTKLKGMNILGIPTILPDNFFQHISSLEIEVVCMVGQFLKHLGNSLANLHHLKMLDLTFFWTRRHVRTQHIFMGSTYIDPSLLKQNWNARCNCN